MYCDETTNAVIDVFASGITLHVLTVWNDSPSYLDVHYPTSFILSPILASAGNLIVWSWFVIGDLKVHSVVMHS